MSWIQRQQLLLRAVDALEPQWQREAVLVLSVALDYRSENDCLQTVSKAGVRAERGRQLTYKRFMEFLRHLTEAGIAVTFRGRVTINSMISEVLARRAVDAGRYRGIRNDVMNRYWVMRDDGEDTAGRQWFEDIHAAMRHARNALYEKRFVRANAV